MSPVPSGTDQATADDAVDPVANDLLSGFWTWVLGSYLVVVALGLGYLLLGIIPAVLPDGDKPKEIDLLYLVIIVGAFGSYVHAATSFASYVGNRRMGKSWVWWYLLRPLIGSALALVFYFVVRAGFMQNGSGAESVNPFGIAALSGLTGMFSKQATDKLRELFDNFFKAEDKRRDKLDEAGETVASLVSGNSTPAQDATAGTAAEGEALPATDEG